LLQDEYKLATLSRGYGRNTSGCIIANESSSYHDIGDESLQYQQKFSQLNVAVDKSRKRGIKVLFNTYSDLNCILLDDAFQHRYVKPGLQILLTDYHNLYINDYLIPTGSLREFRKGAKRADIIIVTKTAPVFSPFTRERLKQLLKPKKHQKLYFSHICYGEKIALTDFEKAPNNKKYYSIVMFSGIANSYPLQEHLRTYCSELIIIDFPDHHKYTCKDIKKINSTYDDIFSRNKVVFTTEKDAIHLIKTDLFEKIKHLPIYYIPIEVKFHLGGDKDFNKQIVDYVKKNRRDGRLYKNPN
jgi:tetraacyldisaccharide 4'-kinase